MSNLKTVDVNETAEQLPPEEPHDEPQNEPVAEQPQEVQEDIKNEPVTETKQEQPPEETKPVEKFKPVRNKMTTCQKCGKYMLLKSYRYKHEKNLSGEHRRQTHQSKSKAKAKGNAQM